MRQCFIDLECLGDFICTIFSNFIIANIDICQCIIDFECFGDFIHTIISNFVARQIKMCQCCIDFERFTDCNSMTIVFT